MTVFPVILGKGISAGSDSCLDSATTIQAAARPETPARKTTIHARKHDEQGILGLTDKVLL